jgi:hypothetical protein
MGVVLVILTICPSIPTNIHSNKSPKKSRHYDIAHKKASMALAFSYQPPKGKGYKNPII